ncbi:DNA polymerase III subunit gamma/tau [Microseira wollei]|uniref:DNA polymerase III subunit gamma/tau n=1 Tax=Microseira wollei NIES-4236 TaxID=2530354 RepID=A0AAV3XAW6_9CYAN|nr:DNA polymerase III subunit gamma/tau [Microseira wollei]GET38548.1 DNA polymerase III, subunits gamma and tau [Microseira wollei NIES-4236]
MPYEPLHHKYRPQRFGDLVGQEAIATTLTNAILSRRIAPAYLFTGPRGTGKTSSARILAKSLNCLNSEVPTELPCGVCSVCRGIELANGSALDVIEIDAASNTGVDNIRDLIEKAQFAPVQCRYKVYLIDEVHMLSQAAFNCLLKTLEEPPKQVVFVLATTDPQRVLPTIISRCQRFDFRRIPLQSMVKHLGNIAAKENIDIAPEALTLVAQVAQGGLRDAESLLDQLSLLPGQVTVDGVWDLVGAVPERDLMALLYAIADDKSVEVIDITRRLMDRGREPLIVLQNLAGFYRDLLIAKTAPNRSDLVACTEPTWNQLCQFSQKWEIPYILAGQKHLKDSEVQIKNTTQPRLWLEVTLLGLLPSAINSQVTVSPSQEQTVDRVSHNIGRQQQSQTQQKPTYQQEKAAELSPPPVQQETPKPTIQDREINAPQTNAEPSEFTAPPTELDEIWRQVIENLQPATKALVSQHCHLLNCDENVAYIKVSTEPLFKLAQQKLSNIEAAFFKLLNRKVKVKLEVGGSSHSRTVGKSETRSHPKENFPPDTIPTSTTKQFDQSELATPKEIQPLANTDLKIADKEDKEENATWYKATSPAVSNPSPLPKSVVPEEENSLPSSAIQVAESTEDSEIDEVAIAAQKLVEFFKGKVVKLTDDLELLDPVSTTTTPAADFKPQYSEATGEFELEEPDDEPF